MPLRDGYSKDRSQKTTMHVQQIQSRDFEQVNLYIVDERRDGGGVGLVDACLGPDYARLRRRLGNRRVEWVFITHWHCDHVGGLGRVVADYAPTVYCSAETAPFLCGEKTWRDSHFWRQSGPWWIKPLWGLAFLLSPLPLVEDVTVVAPGEMLDFGGARWQVLSLPGHTLGHVGLYDPEQGALFSGDAVLRRRNGDLGPSMSALAEDRARLFETVERVRSMGLRTIYPGHFSYGPVRAL